MPHPFNRPSHPIAAIIAISSYVACWPLRHVRGSDWLRARFTKLLERAGSRSIERTYGLYFHDPYHPPKISDLAFVTLMQVFVVLAFAGSIWTAWAYTHDYVLPLLIAFSVFHLVPSPQDFLTEGRMADRVPSWLSPLTGALSFVVSLPAMVVALPVAILWGSIGALRITLADRQA